MTDISKDQIPHKNNTVFSKLFRVGLSEDEWAVFLNDWNDRVNWKVSKDGKEQSVPLLQEWVINKVPPETVFRLVAEKNGTEIWTEKTETHESPLFFFLRNLDSGDDKAFSHLLPLLKKDHLVSAIDRIMDQKNKSDVIVDEEVKLTGDMLIATYLKQKDSYVSIDVYLKTHPEAIHARHVDQTLGSLLSITREGWDTYMRNGGSPFDRVYTDPIAGGKADMPLWQWLFKKKIYHPSMQKTLHDLLMRLHEGREPEKDDYVLNDADWADLVKNKTKIVNEIAMIEFEKNIETDWKAAIKGNKKWRDWRSGEGGNFIFWLCGKIPSDFIRQAHKTKLNHPLIKQHDSVGRNFMHYLLTGVMTANLGSYRRAEKIKNTLWPGMMKTIDPMIDKNPSKGIFADWLSSSGEAYFGALRKSESQKPASTHDFSFMHDFLKQNPAWFWAGIDGQTLSKIFESDQKTGMAVRLLTGLGGAFTLDQVKPVLSQLSSADKFKLAVLMNNENLKRHSASSHIEQTARTFFPEIIEQPFTSFSLQEIQQMLQWIKKQGGGYYYQKSEEFHQLTAYLEKANMMLKIGNQAQEKKEAPGKRRM